MYLGIDLGTSGVKVVIMDEEGQVLDSASSPLSVSRPQPLWSEQDPEHWWQATDHAVMALAERQSLRNVQAIGLSGQMHGATLLDRKGSVLRPAILWNDGRSFPQCQALTAQYPEIQAITGNLIMPGFTLPKISWLREHEPQVFAQIAKVLLPKDYLRFRLTGEFATDMSDASGTLWLDVTQRQWDDSLLATCGLTRDAMPALYEGPLVTGKLRKSLAERWCMGCVPVMAGGGDNAAGAIGVGVVEAEQTMLSLGTSGVIFSVSDGCFANPDAALHSFAHALPNKWHAMSVMLSAASAVEWVSRLVGYGTVAEAVHEAEIHHHQLGRKHVPLFLPYLAGERTPHNNPNAKGVFVGMDHNSSRAALVLAVLEGVSFALLDGLDTVRSVQPVAPQISVIGGGSRSGFWLQMLADSCERDMVLREGGDVGPALGAARLAAIGYHGEHSVSHFATMPPVVNVFAQGSTDHQERRHAFQDLYYRVREAFPIPD